MLHRQLFHHKASSAQPISQPIELSIQKKVGFSVGRNQGRGDAAGPDPNPKLRPRKKLVLERHANLRVALSIVAEEKTVGHQTQQAVEIGGWFRRTKGSSGRRKKRPRHRRGAIPR